MNPTSTFGADYLEAMQPPAGSWGGCWSWDNVRTTDPGTGEWIDGRTLNPWGW